jgi:nitroimidazol reductase NimA-like FMN-containing flavoprotein (pyridoxamine 5'-phosphate oxidase superfamily)
MGKLGVDDLADLRTARLTAADIEELLDTATECTLIFAATDGWPMGVVVSFLRFDDRIWFTAVDQRQHIRGITSDPRVSLVVTSAGTPLEGRRMVALKGEARLHNDRITLEQMLPRIAQRLAPGDPQGMVRLLDTEHRTVVEVQIQNVSASHDSRKIAGDGRGGASAAITPHAS